MILSKRDRAYYYAYMRKLRYNLMYTHSPNKSHELAYLCKTIFRFKDIEKRRISNTFFTKPKKMIDLAVHDALDVLNSMMRWEGVDTNEYPLA